MVFADWTYTGNGCAGQSGTLDGSIKYAGASSLNLRALEFNACYATLIHNTFSQAQAQIIAWVRTEDISRVRPTIYHSSYGTLVCTTSANATWQRFKASFWYDATTNTKWGRVERWDGYNWVQIGGDTNFGAGAAGAGSLTLGAYGLTGQAAVDYSCWFDEVEVYA